MKDYFDEAITYENLRSALNRCCRNVRWKDSVVGYELHAPQNTLHLLNIIRDGKYRISPYQRFIIYEPKRREIVATRIVDRQVQMALCMNGLYDDIVEHFIHDNCACQTGRGTDYTFNRMKAHLRRFYLKHGKEGWVLKCDVHHFFPSTQHDVAKAAVAKRVSDPKAAKFVFDVIDSFGGDAGIGLGSQISQLIELAVLDDLDHFIKEKLRIKHYVRYMDDFILIHHDKEYLKLCRDVIQKELSKIGLELNQKTTLYPLRQGVRFLQWRFVLTQTGGIRMKMTGDKQGRERRRLKKIVAKETAGIIEAGTAERSLQAWIANAERGDTYWQVKHMREHLNGLRRAEHGNGSGKDFESGSRRMAGESECRKMRGKHRLSGYDERHRNSYG